MIERLRHFIATIACAFISDKAQRRRMRVILKSPVARYINFIRADTGRRHPRIKYFIGYQARNLIVGVDDRWIYKFPLRANHAWLAVREARILDALAPLSPVPVPRVELIGYKNQIIRKYDFVRGVTLRTARADDILRHRKKLARQVAQFLIKIGRADPVAIRDLKPRDARAFGFMYGWCQGDICDNFIIDNKTMNVIAFIDWEDSFYGDFSPMFDNEKRTPGREFMAALRTEYEKLYAAEDAANCGN